ncbi:MAG: Zn-dependent hydrolase [Acidimicrobiales bacterium]
MPTSSHPHLRIDGDRLLGRLDELARIAPIDGGGVCRLALTDEDRLGRDLVVAWMHDLGLHITTDGIGNVVGVRDGVVDGPPVMCGSHVDTVRTGGRYDGNLGVLAGLEVIETLAAADITTHHPLAVAFFTNEEGSRFAPDMMGSLVHVGGLALETALDTVGIDGVSVAEALDGIGYRGTAPSPATPPRAFVELHIEQGPVLEAEGYTIGVVTGVQGISWTEVTIEGQSNHAGTTPMDLRHDAGYAAAEIATFVRGLATTLGPPMVGTVGAIDLHPNLVNVVAARAVLTVDLRHTDESMLVKAEGELIRHLDELAATEGVAITTRPLARFEPVEFDPVTVDLVARTADTLGHRARRLPSGAGHDAQMLARVWPTAMVFTPSRDGISHNPAEHTDPADLIAGADVLLQTLLALAAGGEQ